MSQFSVYTKYCYSLEKSESICNHVATYLPAGGKVDILTITDRQFFNVKRFYAKKQLENERHPRQLHLFGKNGNNPINTITSKHPDYIRAEKRH